MPDKKLTKKQIDELNIRLNKNIAGEWDFDILANDFELEDLLDWGFDENELDINLWKPDVDEEKLDEVPEPEKEAVSQLGDIFLLDGKHRVMCGDSTKKEDVEKLMDGNIASAIITSPPYWVGKDYESQDSESDIDIFINLICSNIINFVREDNSRIIINTGTGMATRIGEKKARVLLLLDKWIDNLFKDGWYLRNIRHWLKGGGGSGVPIAAKSDFVYSGMEYLLTLYNPNGAQRGQNKLSESWCQQSDWNDIKGDKQENKAGYPIELPLRFVKLYTLPNEIILEPFAGNGTNFIAAEQTNRICYGMELDPIYIDVILRRYKNLYPESKIECLNRKFDFEKLWQDQENK